MIVEENMAQQNIYDNEIFFEGYKKIRDNKINANNLFEIPALFSMLPDLKNKRVLDLGCGFGEHCKRFIECGAKKVVGIDISEKMLEVARNENSDPNIIYINMPMEKIATVYKGNIIKNLIMDCQSYTKYRPNETTGGIFVSWRRKEELPTGA